MRDRKRGMLDAGFSILDKSQIDEFAKRLKKLFSVLPAESGIH
jgi:hypothetical protein